MEDGFLSDAVPTLPVALVGLGEIGRTAHLPALRRHPIATPVLIVDPAPERRALAGEVPTAPDIDAVLADDSIRAVVLATPPWVTTPLAARILATGRYVLAEKPIAVSSVAAKPLLDLDTQDARRLQVGLTYRHDPALALLRSWLAAERLGSPLLVRAHIYDEARSSSEHDERIVETLQHGSPAVHEGAHLFDWLRFLIGDPLAVDDAWGLHTVADLPAPNLTGARLSYPDGATVLVEFGWLTDRLPRCELSFLGPRGLAVLDGFTFGLRLETADGSETPQFQGDRTTRSFDRQLDRFVALALGAVEAPSPNLEDALAALDIGERIDALA
jgi:predicted dehydrogenase